MSIASTQNKGAPHFGRIRDVFYVLFFYLLLSTIFFTVENLTQGQTTDDANSTNLVFVIEEFLDSLLFLGVTLFVLIRKYKKNLDDIGLAFKDLGKNIWKGLIYGFVLWVIVFVINYGVVLLIGEGPIDHPLIERLQSAQYFLDYFFIFFSGCILAPIAEEIYFRGFVYKIFISRYSFVVAVIFCNVLFALVHLSPWWFVQTFCYGVGLSMTFKHSNSLVTPIICHSTVNFLELMFRISLSAKFLA